MDYVRLGSSNLMVSRFAVGCMSFGEHGDSWKLGYEASRELAFAALEAGVNFFDTANVYAQGKSEEYTGRILREAEGAGLATRDDVVVATKVYGPMGAGPNRRGLSRKAILQELDHSLERLGMDYVDLYIAHRLDPDANLEETMGALHDAVRSGKARYLGVSNAPAWLVMKAQAIAEAHGWARFVSLQDRYNLLCREDEREALPMCADQGLAYTPHSALASGRLARTGRTARGDYDGERHVSPLLDDCDQKVVGAVAAIAEERGTSMATVSLAYLLGKDMVPIVGMSKTSQLEGALGALGLELAAEEVARLEEHYLPHPKA